MSIKEETSMHFLTTYRTRISQAGGLLFLFLCMFSQKELDLSNPFLTGVLFLLGCICVGFAVVGRLWCAQYIAGYKNDVLVREGPYSLCRNPLYFFSFLGAVGVGLCTESLTLTLLLVVLFVLMYIPVIHSEEVKLLGIFGAPYQKYLQEVPRFLPNLALFHEPKEYMVKPHVFRQAARDVIWFVVAVGALECLEGLQDAGILPMLITLY